MDVEGIGPFVRRRREELGLSQTRLAELVGTSRGYMSQIEAGRTQLPNPSLRRRLAEALGVRHLDLLIAAGELTSDEVPQAGPPPSSGQALAAQIERLRPDDRRSVEWTVCRLAELSEAEESASPVPPVRPVVPAP